VMRKLRRGLRTRSRDFASRQRIHPRSRRSRRRIPPYDRHCTRSRKASPSPRCRILRSILVTGSPTPE
jgi:hypothetical protein